MPPCAPAEASDPISAEGLTSYLRSRAEIEVLPAEAGVVVTAVEPHVRGGVGAAAEFGTPVVLVVNEFADCELLTVVECRVVAVVLRAAAAGERLLHSVETAASGGGVLPPQLLGDLLKHLEQMQRDVLTPREVKVLQMIADGLDTGEIAKAVCYSERTVKNQISGVTTRLKLRNRSHAVACAMRAGMF